MKFFIFILSSFLCVSTSYAQKKIYIIHGYGASINDHWFSYIKKNLESKKKNVTVISLPDSSNPSFFKWKKTIKENVQDIDKNTFFVAHSLGCITLLNFLSESNFQEIGGVVCVSGFSNKLPSLPQLDSYIKESVNDFSFNNKIFKKMIFISSNDSYVPPSLSIELAKKLNSPYLIVPNSGHFLDSDGYKEFPQLLHWLKKSTD